MIYGEGNYRYQVVESWGRGAGGREPGGVVAGVAVDSRDRVYAFVRGDDPVQVYDREGNLLKTWGQGLFPRAHGIWISPEDIIYLTDCRDHTIRKYNTDGELLMTMGTSGVPGENGAPFNGPNDAVEAPSGEIYVGDNRSFRVHKFSAEGKLLRSWGEEGEGPSQFTHVHNVRIDSQGRVLVADRESSRVEIFDTDGNFLSEWKVPKPNGMCIDRDGIIHITEEEKRKIIQYTEDGEQLGQWGKVGKAPGEFKGFLHGIAIDSHGDAYLCEILRPDRLQKFQRV